MPTRPPRRCDRRKSEQWMLITDTIQFIVLFIMLLTAATAQQLPSKSPSYAKVQATFKSSNGDVIDLHTQAGLLVTPRPRIILLKDCSDKSQVCLTDRHGFAFAYFRKCSDAGSGDYKSLRFRPKVVSVLHDSDIWMVFDASPKYLFHYAYGRGIVGIYKGPTASYDFRNVLHDQNFRIGDLEAMEYRITASSDAVAPCNE
jgi:hypothetical protein